MEHITSTWAHRGEPLYRRVKRQMTELLGRGVWRPAQVLPSERKLADHFGVSMGTMRRAVDELVSEHILIRHQGRGTFVSAHDRSRYLFRFFNLSAHDGGRSYPVVSLLDFDSLRADAATARALGLRSGARVLRIRNRLALQGEATLLDDILLPAARFEGMDRSRVAQRAGTLYQLYEEAFGQSVARIDERVRACPADTRQAQLLGVAPGTALLHIIRTAHGMDEAVIELRHSYVRTDRHEYARGVAGATG
jgi:GntR family transcriptional regulator